MKILAITTTLIILVFCLSFTVFGQGRRISIDALTDELQLDDSASDRMTLIFWMPEEFWRVSLQDEKLSDETKEQFYRLVCPYTVVVVVDGKFGSTGAGSYRTEKDVLSQIRLIDGSKTEYAVLSKSELGADLDTVIGVMQPILSGMLGKLGDNMHFAIFPGKNGKGERLADPTKPGSLRIRLQPGREFGWQFPLASLLPLKICPIDKAEMNGGWKYCPFHGAELK